MEKVLVQFSVTSRRLLWLMVLWQAIAVMLMAFGVWPYWIAWVNVALLAVYVLLMDTFEGLLLIIASIPFYVIVTIPNFGSLPSWRLLFIWLFGVWVARTLFQQRHYLEKMASLRHLYRQTKMLEHFKLSLARTMLGRIDSRFMAWDKFLALLLLVMLLSLIFAYFRIHAIKQILFLINIYLLYVVLINTTTTRERIVDLIRYAAASTGIIILLGYVQFVATLFSSPYYFWQYWAVMVSRLYYGSALADVLIYSNSWFSYYDGQQSLRMFSIMPDSHSFAMIGVLCIGFCLPLLVWHKSARKPLVKLFTSRAYYLWYAVRFSGLAIILSGTRGVWVGMIPTLFIGVVLYMKKFARTMVKKILIAQILIILFFALTPVINYGLQLLRVSNFEENFLDRARSIYDLQEDSNVGRIIIWRESLIYAATHPFGVGYGNFVVSVVRDIPDGQTFEETANKRNLRYNLPQKFVSAHSLYLNILVELGLAGLLACALFFWSVLAAMWRFLYSYAHQENIFTMTILSVGMVIIWFLGYGIFDVTILNDRVLMYFFVGLGIAGLIMTRYESFEESRLGPNSDIISS